MGFSLRVQIFVACGSFCLNELVVLHLVLVLKFEAMINISLIVWLPHSHR
jgi:hypothetical protein